MAWILYIHILAACAWIGGSIVLFGLGVFLKDKTTQEAVYSVIGPFYGYFETVWLIISSFAPKSKQFLSCIA